MAKAYVGADASALVHLARTRPDMAQLLEDFLLLKQIPGLCDMAERGAFGLRLNCPKWRAAIRELAVAVSLEEAAHRKAAIEKSRCPWMEK